MSARDTNGTGRDEIQIGPELSPGVHLGLRRTPDGTVTRVTCSPSEDGVPLAPGAEVVDVETAAEDGWHKLTSLYKMTGPAQVATTAYREGHDRIFGKKQKVGLA
jgi:hypothetical protein